MHIIDWPNVANSTDGGGRIILAMVDDKEKALPLKIYSKPRNESPQCSVLVTKAWTVHHKVTKAYIVTLGSPSGNFPISISYPS